MFLRVLQKYYLLLRIIDVFIADIISDVLFLLGTKYWVLLSFRTFYNRLKGSFFLSLHRLSCL